MDALLMCGGRGRRFAAEVEKPLYPIGGRPMVDRVRDAVAASRIDRTYAVVSSHAPDTKSRLDGVRAIETPGDGYVPDLGRALRRVETPVLTVAADLPLLTGEVVDAVLEAHDQGPLTVYVPVALKRRLGLSLDETRLAADGRTLVPSGLNVVADGAESRFVTDDVRLAVNVNRPGDARIAEALL